jgi:hypothetical protein
MFYFVGKTGVPVQGILTSNAVSLNLKICIYIYVAHKYPERRTILAEEESKHLLIPCNVNIL